MDRKTRIIGFLVVLVITIFTFSVVSVFNENSEKELKEIRDANTKAEERAKEEERKSKEAEALSKQMAVKISGLEGQLKEQNVILNRFQKSYSNSLIELNKYKNEKDYVPDNATSGEQSDFLSNYKYKEY